MPSTITPPMLTLAFFGLLSSYTMTQAGETRSSKSISYSSSAELDKTVRDAQLKQAEPDVMAPLLQTGFRLESAAMALHTTSTDLSHGFEYVLYDAATDLISDFDGDGFYHRFSVSIDADTTFASADVYARLYLSYEGGPWNHFATTSAYHISGDSSLDNFVIETELAEGFVPGYYDVRIELYDAALDEWLLSYGPYDDASLSALPLEDSVYDDEGASYGYPVETHVVVAAGGSMSEWLLVLAILLFSMRRLHRIKQ